jgi:hypothetical protein
VFGLNHNTDVRADGAPLAWRWPRPEWARKRDRRREESLQMSELRWQWRSACSGTSLAPMIYTPSGATRAAPLVDHIDLGPPIALTVRIRPGQSIDDFIAAAPAIAPVLNAKELRITSLPHHRLRVVLVTAPLVAVPDRAAAQDADVLPFGA